MRSICSCTPPTCGDNHKNQPVEACDGTDDSACPGQCNSYCLCPGPACTNDASRTLFADPLGCFTFNGNQSACLNAYEAEDASGHLAQCLYTPSTNGCYSCDSSEQLGRDCTNSCQCGNGVVDPGEECDGVDDAACPGNCLSDCRCAPPPCTQAPALTFVGWLANSSQCYSLHDQASCESSFFVDETSNRPQSCYFFAGGCNPCDEDDQSSYLCVNHCACGNNVAEPGEDCDGSDNSACGGTGCMADCRCTPPSCGDNIVNGYDEACDGTDDSACPGHCQGDCTCAPYCGDGGVNQPSETCDGADNSACGGLSCLADCTCIAPSCGDNITNQPSETCDGTDNSACGGLACLGDCTCTAPSCGDNIKNQPSETCDGTDDSACPGHCQGDCQCPP